MGLFRLIKNKYYDHRLKVADKRVVNGDIDDAMNIYHSLLGKQPWAAIYLARLLIDNSSEVREKIEALQHIRDLRKYVVNETEKSYFKTLETHVLNMELLASECFSKALYDYAVLLLCAIKDLRPGVGFENKLNRCRAFSAFVADWKKPFNKCLFAETIKYLKAVSASSENDLKYFAGKLVRERKYLRAFNLLLSFQNVGSWVMTYALSYVQEIVLGKDSDIIRPTKISDFCDDIITCKICANHLFACACNKAQCNEYELAILYDAFAAEYLSDNNQFNFERSKHILEELSSRAEASEIVGFNRLSGTFQLTSEQMQWVENRVLDIANKAKPNKAIAICRLYLFNQKFAILYIVKCLEEVRVGGSVDTVELLSVIKQQTNDANLPDYLALFVNYIPSYESDFLASALRQIKATGSIELLGKYWSIYPNSAFIYGTVSNTVNRSSDFASYISRHADLFLINNVYKDAFCKALRTLIDIQYVLRIFESLIGRSVNVIDSYIEQIIDFSKKQSQTEIALQIVNRGLSHAISGLLMEQKKYLITALIKEGKLDLAESEIHSILSVDIQANSLLAELYWERAMRAITPDKVELLLKILDIAEAHVSLNSLENLKAKALSELTKITKSIYESNEKLGSTKIVSRIKPYSDFWVPLFIWIRNTNKETQASSNKSIEYDLETLKEISKNFSNTKGFNYKELNSLWKEYVDCAVKKAKSQPLETAIIELSDLREFEIAWCPNAIEEQLLKAVSYALISSKWTLAIEREKIGDYLNAINIYKEIINDTVGTFVNCAELRYLICHIKSGTVNDEIETRIGNALQMHSHQSLREDLAYRYAVLLLQNTKPSEAEHIIRTYLPCETQILSLCENVYLKEAEKNLNVFNSLIGRINDGKMPLKEALELKRDLQSYKKKITGKLTDLSRAFSKFQSRIEAYILLKMYEEEAYSELLTKLMSENPNYVESDVDFRNIAIASLGVLESGINDDSILKRAIATILTAIYSDRLFVQSLDHTSWDDKFTFTLKGSLGASSIYDYDELPENVNFDEPSENVNVAISDVQKSLLGRVETAVRKMHPHLESFMTDEINALDRIIELNLDKDYILASPFLCRTLASVRRSIENSFEYELGLNYGNREDIIALGVIYGFNGGEYEDYRKAYNYLLSCKNAIADNSTTLVESVFTQEKVRVVRQYVHLYSDLKSTIATAMNSDVKSNMDYKIFLDKYETVCISLKDISLSFTCSNYVNGEIIHLLNKEIMKLREGVGYMVRLYNIAPTNEKIKSNTEGVIIGLVHEAEKSNMGADRMALNNAIKSLNGAFSVGISLATIIAKVNNDKIEEYQALAQLYKLYTENSNNHEVCDSLAALVKICIHKYFAGDTFSGRSEVRKTLNKLKNNKSIVFKEKAKMLALEYINIFKEMPEDMQILLLGGFSSAGSILSTKGELLKEGLDYMKEIGDVDEVLKKH